MEDRAEPRSWIGEWGVPGLGTVVALLFCFWIYPALQGSVHANLDPDDYGRIGRNLHAGHGLSIDPAAGPTVYRGPGYPAFLALSLALGGGWFPGSIWIAQSLVHGATAWAAARLSRAWFGASTALWAGLLVALHPAVFWYAPRTWNDALLAFLVTLLLVLTTRVVRTGAPAAAAGAGAVLGAATLVKGIFLPWIVLLPLAIVAIRRRARESRPGARASVSRALAPLWIAVVAMVVVAPWTVRNHRLTGELVPVHTGAAFNFVVGQEITRNLAVSPFGYGALWNHVIDDVFARTDRLASAGVRREIEKEAIYREIALRSLRTEPGLVLGHLAFFAAAFWYIGETPAKTAVLFALRLPVLILGFWGIVRAFRARSSPAPALGAALVLLFWLSHAPFAPPVRLSLPVFPALAVFAVGTWFTLRRSQETSVHSIGKPALEGSRP